MIDEAETLPGRGATACQTAVATGGVGRFGEGYRYQVDCHRVDDGSEKQDVAQHWEMVRCAAASKNYLRYVIQRLVSIQSLF